MRSGSVERTTNETSVSVTVNLDGVGRFEGTTGVGFFDHMLAQLARHSLVDITVEAEGDLHIDDHHTVEDTGIALGQAIRQALGDMKGVMRYADVHLPMDGTLSRAAIDISGRPFLVFQVEFPREKDRALLATKLGQLVVQLKKGEAARCAKLAFQVAPDSDFKALARALRAAIAIDPRMAGELPTTKGKLGG